MSTVTQTQMQTPTLSDPHPTIQVYSTLAKRKEPFRTVEAGKVGIYLCGPTVYKPSHIGHMVGPVIFDAIKRYLVYCGYQVTWVVNITDVDDKLIAEASKRGTTMPAVAEEMNTARAWTTTRTAARCRREASPTPHCHSTSLIRSTAACKP
jgi:cysteinyl-tRNA synthetase